MPDTLASFNSSEQLTVEDVWLTQKYMMVEIKWSKTLQTRERELTLPLVPAKNKAVFWIGYLLKCRPKATAGQPLLAYVVRGHVIPITYDVLSRKLKEWVTHMGRQGERFSLHGLKRGGTNHALTVGICGEDLQLMGDWRSNAYMEYIDLNMQRKFSNMVKFVKVVDKRVDKHAY